MKRAFKLRNILGYGRKWQIIAVVLMATLLTAPLLADCPNGQSCVVGIGSEQFTVTGPCVYADFSKTLQGCTVTHDQICISACDNPYPPLAPPPPPTTVCTGGVNGIYCTSPVNTVQDLRALNAVQPLEQEARKHIASLRGVPDDTLNAYWSRGEIRAYMYLRLLQMAYATSPLSAQDQATSDYYTAAINSRRTEVATNALTLYNSWRSNPCQFLVPGANPRSYLDDQATVDICRIQNTVLTCLLGCDPPLPSSQQFTAWAVSARLQKDITTWGAQLEAVHYLNLSLAEAQATAALEYDLSFGGVAEGVAYLTAKHSQIANLPTAQVTPDDTALQGLWLGALHEFGSGELRDTVVNSVAQVFQSGIAGGSEATLAQTFDVQTIFSESDAALVESTSGVIAESWDTFVGPAITALAVIAYEAWQSVETVLVPDQLQKAINDASGRTLNYYAQNADLRGLILEEFLRSTAPDFIVARLGDTAFGTAPSAGPVSSSDPWFIKNNSGIPSSSFRYTDWANTLTRVSVANGWLVSASDGHSYALRYSPSLSYLTQNSTQNVEQWRAWIDGTSFLAEREAVQVGTGHVEGAANTCPSNITGSGTPINLGNICVAIAHSGSFLIKKNDVIVMDGQVRKAAGDEFLNGGTSYVQTTEPFADPAPPDGTLSVLVQPDGNCNLSSVLGARIAGPDCTSGTSITTDQGSVTIVTLVAPTLSVTGGTFVYNGQMEAATGSAYGAGGPSDIQTPGVTFSYAGISPTYYAATATAPTDAGTYQVTGSFLGNASYKSGSATATLTITQATATIMFNAGSLNQVYDGNVKTVGTTTNPAGLSTVQLSFTGTPLNAGNYPVVATLSNLDYLGSASGTLVISKANPTVSFTGAPASAALGTKFSVSATTNATAIASITAAGACSIAANNVTMISNMGTCQLNAAWATDTNYLAASATQVTATPGSQIVSLLTTISSFSLSPQGPAKSFYAQLQQVSIDLQGTGNGMACSDLASFISHVQAQAGKHLTAVQAQQMLAGAAQIRNTLGCS